MTLETGAIAIALGALPAGILVEYFGLARWLFGKPAGDEPSLFRLAWLGLGSLLLFKAGGWVYDVLVPRDPSLLVSRFAYFVIATMGVGFAFYAAREVGHFLRARLR